jgi:hypothetical protein
LFLPSVALFLIGPSIARMGSPADRLRTPSSCRQQAKLADVQPGEVTSGNSGVDNDATAPDAIARGGRDPRRWAQAVTPPRLDPRRWARALRRRLTLENLNVLVLALLVLVVHDVGYIFSQPYWTDEDWVALTTKFPLSQLLATTNSTPIGFSVLIRFFSVSGTQSARIVPLAFAGAAVVVAYWFARRLDWPRVEASLCAGLLAGIGMLMVPAMLDRDDLKQYTTDAFFAVVVLALTSRLERNWSRRMLAVLSVATWGGMLFSDAVAFMGAASFAAVWVVQLTRRDWRRLREASVAGLATAILILAVYKAFDAQAVTPSLTYSPHFTNYYPPLHSGAHAFFRFLHQHMLALLQHFGLGPLWLGGLLFVLGVATVFWRGRPATAVALALLWPEMVVLSALRLYPFLDARTSTFLFAVTAVVAAIGVAGVCSLLWPYLKGLLAIELALAAAAGFVVIALPSVRSHPIPYESMKSVTLYVADHAAANDVIVLAQDSNFGFAYYWRTGQPARESDSTIIQGYEAYFPGQPRIVMALSRTPAGVNAAMDQALAQSRERGCTPIWLIRTHTIPIEEDTYNAWIARQHVTATELDGTNDLFMLQVPRSECQ